MMFRSTSLPAVFAGALSLLTPLLVLPLVPLVAQAQQQAVDIRIPSGTLEQTLNSFGQQAGIVLMFSTDLTRGLNSEGLNGSYTVQQGLAALLNGTGIRHRVEGNTATLVAVGASDVMRLDPVRVGGSGLSDNVPQLSTTIGVSHNDLIRIQPTDLKGVFTTESSVSVGGSIPMNQKLYLHGIEETALAVTIDGARQNNRIFHHSATTLIDPSLLKSVRASAGVSPADDGPGAIGGSLAFETVDVADVLAEGNSFGGFVNSSYDSNSKTATIAASLFAQQNGFEVLGFINKADGDDYKSGNGDTVPFTEADLLSGLAKMAYEAESGDRFELSYESVTDDAVRPYRANFVGLTAGRPTPESRNYDLARTNIVFNYSNQQTTGLWNPSIMVAQSETDLTTSEISLADPTVTFVYSGIANSDSFSAENLFITQDANITTGVDFYQASVVFKFASDPVLKEEADNMGLFVQVRQDLQDTVRFSYGARYDQQDFTGLVNSSQDDSGLSANVSAEFDVGEYITINAGYASVWGGVALGESFILNPAWDYSAGIDSVESKNAVVGIESNLNDYRFGANYYKTDISNGRTPSWGGGPGLVADFEVTGHDIFVSYENINSQFSLKYSNIKSDKNGEAASSYDGNYFTSPLGELITVSATQTYGDMGLSVGANVEASLDNNALGDTVLKQEGYTVLNIFADYQVSTGFSVRFEANNLADEDYTDRASYGQEFATVIPLYEPGRAFKIGMRLSF